MDSSTALRQSKCFPSRLIPWTAPPHRPPHKLHSGDGEGPSPIAPSQPAGNLIAPGRFAAGQLLLSLAPAKRQKGAEQPAADADQGASVSAAAAAASAALGFQKQPPELRQEIDRSGFLRLRALPAVRTGKALCACSEMLFHNCFMSSCSGAELLVGVFCASGCVDGELCLPGAWEYLHNWRPVFALEPLKPGRKVSFLAI